MKRKRVTRKAVIALMAVTMVFAGAQSISACTGIYVGPEASTDGTVIIARSNDTQAVGGNHLTVTERVENKPGRTMPVSEDGSVTAEIPETTYKYTATPFMESTMEAYDLASDASACTNEYGVAMTNSVTAFANDEALKADPLVSKGLVENTANDLILCQSKTAREAVEVLLGLIDKYGSAECNVALIADRKEAWCVEMYTGHQYAAVKLPRDMVAAFGNEYVLEYLSDYEESITSKDLEKLPDSKGFAVRDDKGRLNLFKTYSGPQMITDYSHMRTWIGHQLLAPSKFGGDYDKEAVYPFCFKPDRKVGISDVCSIMRNRYDGTKYDPDKTGRIDMRVIGTDTALSVHALQVYPDVPANISCVSWVSSGPAIYGVFVPLSNAATSVTEAYGKDQPAKEFGNFDSDNYAYYAFKELTTLCVDRDKCVTYGGPVRDYWQTAEQGMFKAMPDVIHKAAEMKGGKKAADYITSYCNGVQTKAFEDAKYLINDVIWAQSSDSNTMKLGRNPETGELLTKERELPPMEVDLDASTYGQVPDPAKATASSKKKDVKGLGVPLTAGVLIMLLIMFMLMRKSGRHSS